VWLVSPGYAGLIFFALLLGIGYGGFVALGPPLVAETFGVHGLGGLLGVLYTSAALESAVGPPVAGVLISSSGGYSSSIAASLATQQSRSALCSPSVARAEQRSGERRHCGLQVRSAPQPVSVRRRVAADVSCHRRYHRRCADRPVAVSEPPASR
jgi:hypothetical protein